MPSCSVDRLLAPPPPKPRDETPLLVTNSLPSRLAWRSRHANVKSTRQYGQEITDKQRCHYAPGPRVRIRQFYCISLAQVKIAPVCTAHLLDSMLTQAWLCCLCFNCLRCIRQGRRVLVPGERVPEKFLRKHGVGVDHNARVLFRMEAAVQQRHQLFSWDVVAACDWILSLFCDKFCETAWTSALRMIVGESQDNHRM